MDGIHDLGGKPGYGKVDKTGEDEVFHERWEAAVYSMVNAVARAGALHNVDRFRHSVERVDPEAYLGHGYYGRWLGGLESLLVEAGLLDQQELTVRAKALGASESDLVAARPNSNPDPAGPPRTGPGSFRALESGPEFTVGARVRTASEPVAGHTRLPAYARNRVGEVIASHDGWVFPDTSAHGGGEQPCHLYTVRFSSEELWDKPGFSVSLDLFEPYLSEVDDE